MVFLSQNRVLVSNIEFVYIKLNTNIEFVFTCKAKSYFQTPPFEVETRDRQAWQTSVPVTEQPRLLNALAVLCVESI